MPKILRIFNTVPETQKFLRIGGSKGVSAILPLPYLKQVAAPAVHTGKGNAELLGKAVWFSHEGQRIAGKAVRVDGDKLIVRLAVPSADGILRATDSEVAVKLSDLEPSKALVQDGKVAAFEAGAVMQEGDRKAVPQYAPGESETNGRPIDFYDVEFDAYASTFVKYTKKDRGGDYILPGAFDETIAQFMTNPVMLCDHWNNTAAIAGSYSKLAVNDRGLAVHAVMSNAPGLRDVRFKVMEKHLKGLSIGGIWHYGEDGYGIEKATLFEISLVAIPMNPDALIHTRSLGAADCVKAFAQFTKSAGQLREE